MDTVELEAPARTVTGSVNRSDWASYRAHAAPGFAYEEARTGRRISDVDEVVSAWQRLKSAFPDAAAENVQVGAEGDLTVAQVIWRATRAGPPRTAAGTGSHSGKRVLVADVITMCWQHRSVVLERHRLGLLALMAPLLDTQRAESGRSPWSP